MTILAFNDVSFTPVNSNDNQIWLTSKELAKALGYKQENAVSKIYTRNSDEFSENMTKTIENPRLPKMGMRIFSLRGCHLIAMFAKTKVAKDFRKWVLDVLERDQRTTSKQREIFITACDKLAVENGLRGIIYKNIANHFGYEKPVDMPIDILPEAIAYVYEELLVQEKVRKIQSKDDTNNAFWKEVGIRKIESNNGVLNKLNGLINELKKNQEFLSNSLTEQRYNLTVEKQQSINEQLNQAFCR